MLQVQKQVEEKKLAERKWFRSHFGRALAKRFSNEIL